MSKVRNALRAARSALSSGRAARAVELYREILSLNPQHPEATLGVGHALVEQGRLDEAIAWYRRAVTESPSKELLHGLGVALLRAGRAADAVRALEHAALGRAADPKLGADLASARAHADASALREEGSRLLAQGHIEAARQLLGKAARDSPDPDASALLGRACLADGALDEAATAFGESLRLRPEAPAVLAWLADVHGAAGRRHEAEESLRQALRFAPAFGQAWLRLVHLRRFVDPDDPDLRRLVSLETEPGLRGVDAEAIHFALGKVWDDLGSYDQAFEHWRRANALHRARDPFAVSKLIELMERIATVCDSAFFERIAEFGSISEVPVLVVGVPRCGSTLVEQILASHPRAHGVGELRTLSRLAADLPKRLDTRTPFPECLAELTKPAALGLAADYLGRLTRDAPPDVLRVCDKMLSHVLLLGLVAASFPRATIIHCRRQLMDVGLSMYMHSFSGSGVGYAYDLDDIGRYHQACERLMAHFKRVCPLEIVDLEYEELVASPEVRTRELVGAVGLEWDPRCLDSHLVDRPVHTVSDWQVRQPVHTRSVARFRRYEEHLAPLAKYL